MKHFSCIKDLQRYIERELIEYMTDTLNRMGNEDYQHYTDQDRRVMENKLEDVRDYFDGRVEP